MKLSRILIACLMTAVGASAAEIIARLADGTEVGPDWVRYRAADPNALNPRVLAALTERQLPVVTLAEVPRSLEDVYLHVVEADQ